MKIVLDTNVLVSALIKTGKPRALFFKIAEEEVLILSRSVLEEFLKVADDPRIRRYVGEDDIIAFLTVTRSVAKIVRVKSRFKVVKEDPADDIILRTAYDGKADYIVSGDNHLLSMREFRGIKIVTVDEMLMLL
ncbi:MAG TPA: putative toxin-antitoxin system toxin component, PIN family [Candidatus Bathyarchaeia archaeon]|nr:putative toxin-antitoxin system toxin component, PIN family [Candidatus Bathyarchaeia archaeon]